MSPIASRSVHDQSYEDCIFHIREFVLSDGTVLEDFDVAYRLHGNPKNPLIAVSGGVSSHRGITEYAGSYKPWWKELVGYDKALNTADYCILGWDYLGNDGDTFGPKDGAWPDHCQVSTRDQARLLKAIIDHIGYREVYAMVGASYGAMVNLAFGDCFPHLIQHLISISGAHKSHAMGYAYRYLQNELLDLSEHASLKELPGIQKRLAELSRGLAMTTYRTSNEFEERFSGRDEVIAYLNHHGREFASGRSLTSRRLLAKSILTHDINVDPQRFKHSVIGFEQDTLVPPHLLSELACKTRGELYLFDSPYGHDSFLKESVLLSRLFKTLLSESL
ncbi:MAG: alpha/beta fold hydrolase [Pseudobacteriovorax sp.]|nr:alpha/beta fold hydrolase [Pseudobacteriovorax sp.]